MLAVLSIVAVILLAFAVMFGMVRRIGRALLLFCLFLLLAQPIASTLTAWFVGLSIGGKALLFLLQPVLAACVLLIVLPRPVREIALGGIAQDAAVGLVKLPWRLCAGAVRMIARLR